MNRTVNIAFLSVLLASLAFAQPKLSKIDATYSTLSFTFEEVSGATSYKVVLFADEKMGRQLDEGSTTIYKEPVVFVKLTKATTYFYKATVIVREKESDAVTGSFPTADIPAPSVSPSWTTNSASFKFATVAEAKLYSVAVRDEKGGVAGDRSTVDPSKPITVEGLSSGSSYSYTAFVTMPDGQTSDEASGNFTTDKEPLFPPEVSSSATYNSVTFTFSVVTGATSYSISLKDEKGSDAGTGSTGNPPTPVTIPDLKPKATYSFEATASDGSRESDPTRGTVITAPPPKPNVKYSTTYNSVTFTFDKVDGAGQYSVDLYDSERGGTLVGSGSISDPSGGIVIGRLLAKTTYYYSATVTVSGVEGDPTNGNVTTAPPPTPPPPEVKVAATYNSAAFTFTEVKGAQTYDVLVYDREKDGTLVGSGSAKDVSAPITVGRLSSRTIYYYSATVTVEGVVSDPAKGNFTTDAAPTLPPPEVKLSTTYHSVSFLFSPVKGAASYSVSVSDREGGRPVGEGSTTDPAKAVTISGLLSKTTYYYSATTRSDVLLGDTATGSFTTNAPPEVPRPEVKVVVTYNSAAFTFGEVKGAKSYNVTIFDREKEGRIVGSGSSPDISRPVTIGGLAGKTTYFYEATVTVDDSTGDPTTGSFTTNAPPIVPRPELKVEVTYNSAAFTFGEVKGAKSYNVTLFDREKEGRIVGAGSIPDPSRPVTIGGLLAKTTYFYAATVTVDDSTGDPTTGSFTTSAPPVVPRPEVKVAVTTVSATFTFGEVKGAKSYNVTLFDREKEGRVVGSGSSADALHPVTIGKLTSRTLYYYAATVTVDDSTGVPTTGSFTTEGGSSVPPPELKLEATSNSVAFTFAEVKGASSYAVAVFDSDLNGKQVGADSSGDASRPLTITRLLRATKYYYEATVVVDGVRSDPATGSFATAERSTVPSPEIKFIVGATNITFTFAPMKGAESYDVMVFEGDRDGKLAGAGSTKDPELPVMVAKLQRSTKYTFEATVSIAGVTSDPTTDLFATLDRSPIPAPEVKWIVTSSSVTFTFGEVKGAASYDVTVFEKDPSGRIVGTGSTTDAAKSVVISRLLPRTTYAFEATVSVEGIVSDPVPDRFETLGGSLITPPELKVQPSSTSALFTFAESKGVTSYRVRVFDREGNGSLVGEGSTPDAATSVTVTHLQRLTTYYFEATASAEKDTSDPTRGKFETTERSTVRPPELKCLPSALSAQFVFGEVKGGALYEIQVFDNEKTRTLLGSGTTTDPSKPVTVTRLQRKTPHYYEATVLLEGIVSDPAAGNFETTERSEFAPPELKLSVTASFVSFTFAEVKGATLYETVVLDSEKGGNVVGRASASDASRPVTIVGLRGNTKYFYEASVVIDGVASEPASGSFVTDDNGILKMPTSLRVASLTSTTVFLSWAADPGSQFDVEIIGGPGYKQLTSSFVSASGLTPVTKYEWRARSTDGTRVSEWVAGPAFTTLEGSVTPPVGTLKTPSSLRATGISTTSATLTWTGETGVTFDVEVIGGPSVGSVSSNSVTVNGLLPGASYPWRVRATKGSEFSDWVDGPPFTTAEESSTAVVNLLSGIPAQFGLAQNYPNPFNPSTSIEFALPVSSDVHIAIYNALGVHIAELVRGHYTPGRYVVTWDASSHPSGVYFYRLQTDKFVETKRLLLLK